MTQKPEKHIICKLFNNKKRSWSTFTDKNYMKKNVGRKKWVVFKWKKGRRKWVAQKKDSGVRRKRVHQTSGWEEL